MKLLQKLKTELIKNKSIFIFDFDGVIVDSMTLKGVCFCNIFKDIKHDCNNQIIDFHLINGSLKREKKIDYIVKKILKFKLGHNTEKYINNKILKFEKEYLKLSKKLKLINGLENFLKKINLNNKKSFIVSAAPFKEIEIICKNNNILKYFCKIYDNKMSKYSAISKILKTNSILKKNIIYFGDSNSDYLLSKKMNMDFCSVLTNSKSGLQEIKDIKFQIYDFII